MIPGFVSGLLRGEGVSMGVYKFSLGAHKSGKKEKYPFSNHLLHTASIMSTLQWRISHEAAGDATWPGNIR